MAAAAGAAAATGAAAAAAAAASEAPRGAGGAAPLVGAAPSRSKAARQAMAQMRSVDDDIKQAAALQKEFNELMQRSVELQDKVKTLSLRTCREVQSLGQDIRRLGEGGAGGEAEELLGALRTLDRRATQLRETQPETRSLFSRIVLGRVNVKCFSDRERFRLRDEYNKFKLRTNVIFVLFPALVLLFHFKVRHHWLDTHWITVLHHLWLLYYFVSLALRENILLVNGSNIRAWWIYHHYLSAAGSVAWLVWPPTDIYLSYVPSVTALCLYTGVVQTLQILFFQRRDYANRALGKAGHMDVSYPETITELPKELLVLVPFLFIGQVWQILLGLSFVGTFFTECHIFDKNWTEYREELQVLSSAVLALTLGIGNFVSTVLTVKNKTNLRKQMLQMDKDRVCLDSVLRDAAADKLKTS